MLGRRSIIKRRDDDDITMTRPLNKRVSFSANNHTRLFQVDSDESTRQTNFDSTGQQSSMSLMEHSVSTSLTMTEISRTSSRGMMETTCVIDDGEDTGFDWTDENMEVDLNIPQSQAANNPSGDCGNNKLHTASNRSSLELDDKTRPVELRSEETDSVKNEVLKVASRLLKHKGSTEDSMNNPLDIYGIQAALSQGRQEKHSSPPELDSSLPSDARKNVPFNEIFEITNPQEGLSSLLMTNSINVPRCSLGLSKKPSEISSVSCNDADEPDNIEMDSSQIQEKNLENEESILGSERSLQESQCFSSQSSSHSRSESWYNVTGVNNLEADDNEEDFEDDHDDSAVENYDEDNDGMENDIFEESKNRMSQDDNSDKSNNDEDESVEDMELGDKSSLKFSQQSVTSVVTSDLSTCSKNSSQQSEDENAVQNVSQSPTPVVTLVDSPRRNSSAEEVECENNAENETSADVPELKSVKTRRPTMGAFKSKKSEVFEESVSCQKNEELHYHSSTSVEKHGKKSLNCSKRKTDEHQVMNETYSVLYSTQETFRVDVSNLSDEVEPSCLQNVTMSYKRQSSRSFIHSRETFESTNWTLEDWIRNEPGLFSVFEEPILEHPNVRDVEQPSKQVLELDLERLQKAQKLDSDPELENFIIREKEIARKMSEQCRELIRKLEVCLEEERTVLINETPFYKLFPPTSFKITTDLKTKKAVICYRVSLVACVEVKCQERQKGSVECVAEVLEVPDVVCVFSSYLHTWLKNSFGGRTNFKAASWAEAQSKVISALEVVNTHFQALESVCHRLHWCEKKQKVYLNLVWRNCVVKVYIDADLCEELVPESRDPLDSSFRLGDLHAAWKSNGVSNYRERINKVHRKNLEIAAEETMKSAKF